MSASPDIFRALGTLCEPPEPAHAPIAGALGLPPVANAASYTDVFVFQLVPYAAPYLSPDGMLGGEAGDRLAGFWRAMHLSPPAEPDHLASLLGFYAALAEQENDEHRPGRAGAWREARRALLWEHLLTWVPLYAATMATVRSGFHAAWARLLHQALLHEAQALSPPPATPLHLRDVPDLPGPGSDGFERALLAPVRSGMLITRSDLTHAASLTGLGARPGGRVFTLRALIEQDRAATFEWLCQRATWWARRHRNAIPVLGHIAQHWLGRAEASLRALEQLPKHPRPTMGGIMTSNITDTGIATATAAGTGALTEEDVRRVVRDEVQKAFAKDPAARKAAIIASKGTLDWAYPPLILASSAAAIGMDASVFFTFYGLNIIHKDAAKKLKIDPVGNPAMPMPVPIPDIISSLPGMVPMASAMMRAKFAKNNVATIGELLDTAREAGVRLVACQMTVDVFGYRPEDFIEGVEFAGATAYMAWARRAHVTMFV